MPESHIHKFMDHRSELNETLFKYAGTGTKRFFNLDSRAYEDGAIPAKYKELIGLIASLVLRCDDCISYHLVQSHEAGVSDEEFEEAMHIGLIVGGSITIPHLRRAFQAWDDLRQDNEDGTR